MAAELLGKEIAAFIGLRRGGGHDVDETARPKFQSVDKLTRCFSGMN